MSEDTARQVDLARAASGGIIPVISPVATGKFSVTFFILFVLLIEMPVGAEQGTIELTAC